MFAFFSAVVKYFSCACVYRFASCVFEWVFHAVYTFCFHWMEFSFVALVVRRRGLCAKMLVQ